MIKSFFILSFLLGFAITQNTHYQRITYWTYYPTTSTDLDYHKIIINWSTADIGEEPYANGWKYSFYRIFSNTVSESSKHNNNILFANYGSYLLGYNGLNSLYSYVAWDFTVSCTSPTTTITFFIRYFECDENAIKFYENTSDPKVRFTTTGEDATDTTTISSGTFSGITYGNLLGSGDTLDLVIGKC